MFCKGRRERTAAGPPAEPNDSFNDEDATVAKRSLIMRYHARGLSISTKPQPDQDEIYLGFYSYDGATDDLAKRNLTDEEFERVKRKAVEIGDLENRQALIELKLLSKKLYEMADFVESQPPAIKAELEAELRDAVYFLLHRTEFQP